MAVTQQEITPQYAIYNGDCVEVLPTFPDRSIDLSIYSPPFSDLYNYSSSDNDMSNCRSYEQFLEHYEFLVREVARLTKPGRITATHCMDLKLGPGLRDFPGDIIRMHQRLGFDYHSRHVIWKEPLRVAIRTRALGLMHRQIVKDSSLCRAAGADFLLVFRRQGTNDAPIAHPAGLSSYAGEREVPRDLVSKFDGWKDPKTNKLSHWIWQQYASSVWDDVRIGRVLPYKGGRDKEDEKHVCPLQLDVIERVLTLWSNPGDTVLTPFMGVGSEVYASLRAGRRAIGIELKVSYFKQAQRNIQAALTWKDTDEQRSMFEHDDVEEDAPEDLEADEA